VGTDQRDIGQVSADIEVAVTATPTMIWRVGTDGGRDVPTEAGGRSSTPCPTAQIRIYDDETSWSTASRPTAPAIGLIRSGPRAVAGEAESAAHPVAADARHGLGVSVEKDDLRVSRTSARSRRRTVLEVVQGEHLGSLHLGACFSREAEAEADLRHTRDEDPTGLLWSPVCRS
jgi:hypothetical protein